MDDVDDIMGSRVVLKGKEVENEDLEKEMEETISDHKMSVPFPLSLEDISYLKQIYLPVWPKTSTTFLITFRSSISSKYPYKI